MRILFVTWDGPQVSYLDSLFVPIFAGLAKKGVKVDVLQFRWGDRQVEERSRQACEAAGIRYRAVNIFRRGGGAGAFLSAILGARHLRRAVRDFGSDVIMPRSLMPALVALTAGGRKLRPIVFDADGLAADERVEVGGLDPTSMTYRILRDVEAQMVRHSAAILQRTQLSAEILFHRAGPPVTLDMFRIVANGRDEAVFQPHDPTFRSEVRRQLGVEASAPLLVYAGSLGPQYGWGTMKELFHEVRRLRPDSRLLVLTGTPERAIQSAEEAAGTVVMSVSPDAVPRFLASADVGLAYRSTSYSMQGIAPIKLGEYLLCGLPVIGTAAVGDTRAVVEEGLFFDEAAGTKAAAQWLVGEVLPNRDIYREKARKAGKTEFSLCRSIQDYSWALEQLRLPVAP